MAISNIKAELRGLEPCLESYTPRLGGHRTSRKAPPTDLELTSVYPRQKKTGKNMGHGTEKPLVPQNRTYIKLLIESPFIANYFSPSKSRKS